MADEQQEQQHETVTTITTERNQHKLLRVGELRFEIDVRSDGSPHCCCSCYHFMLLLSCNCHQACANTDESQKKQQYYTVTTTIKRLMITKVLNNLCRFICMLLLLLSHPIFMVLNPIFCYVSPKIVIFHEPLIIETRNKCHLIRHALNPKYVPLKQFQCIFPSQNQQNVKFLPEIATFQELLIAETQNLQHWIQHAVNPKYAPLKPF